MNPLGKIPLARAPVEAQVKRAEVGHHPIAPSLGILQ